MNLFSFDKRSGAFAGDMFVTRRIGATLKGKRDELEFEIKRYVRKLFPMWLIITILVSAAATAVCFMLADVLGESVEASTVTVLMISGGVAAGLMTLCGVIAFIKLLLARRDPALVNITERQKQLDAESKEELDVPQDAAEVDVIACCYRVGRRYRESSKYNYSVWVFGGENALCFADGERILTLPLGHVMGIERVDRGISVSEWNKEEAYNKGRYRAYKVRKSSNTDQYRIKPYYVLTVRDANYCEYTIKVPCYDIEAVLSAAGKTLAEIA